ncbi:MAG TPA: hypothetical protein VG713_04090, partial [Pirellulales bacterium]|nr:hypothetical protein [Pirellulales bacterium]
PLLDQQMAHNHPLSTFYETAPTLQRLEQIRMQRRKEIESDETTKGAAPETPAGEIVEPYIDPVGEDYAGPWLAAVEPVLVARGAEGISDSGWIVLVQERLVDTLRPLARVRSIVRWGGAAAIVVVILIIAALWGMVALVARAPSRGRLSSVLGTATPSAGSTHSTASVGSRSADSAEPQGGRHG